MKKYILSIIALAVICLELIWAVSCINKWRNIYSWNALQSGDTPTSWSSEEHDIKLHIDKNPLTKRTSVIGSVGDTDVYCRKGEFYIDVYKRSDDTLLFVAGCELTEETFEITSIKMYAGEYDFTDIILERVG